MRTQLACLKILFSSLTLLCRQLPGLNRFGNELTVSLLIGRDHVTQKRGLTVRLVVSVGHRLREPRGLVGVEEPVRRNAFGIGIWSSRALMRWYLHVNDILF